MPPFTICVHMSSSVYDKSGKAPTSLTESSAVRRAMMSMSPSDSKRADSSSAGRLTTLRNSASRSGATSLVTGELDRHCER